MVPPAPGPGDDFTRQLREMNAALLVSSCRQHELAGKALETELRQRFMMDSMPQKIFTATPAGDVDYFNPQWSTFTGLPFEGIRGWGWEQVIHPDDLAENLRVWRHSIETGELFELEHRLRRADGQYIWHFSRAVAMPDENGRISMWVGSNTDIHAVKQVELALRDSESRYRVLFESAKDGIMLIDVQSGRVTLSNAFMGVLLGIDPADIVGKDLFELGMFKDIEENQAAFDELRRTGYLRRDHLPMRDRRGGQVDVEFIASVYEENHRLVAQCIVRDISVRSRLGERIASQANELAAQALRKDEFLAMLSHELRNPLAPIRSAVHLLKLQASGTESAIQRQALEIIDRQANNLTKLVNDLLEVSRTIAGRIRLNQQSTDLNQIVRHAIETVAPLLEKAGHQLTLRLCPDPAWVHADATRLEEVFVNLLDNAIKYTPGGGHIEVGSACRSGRALVWVRDDGVGIDAELLPYIFDLFTQADRSLARSAGGLGIGLSLAHRLVVLHGGTIEARSGGARQGSEFTVTLPLVAAPRQVVPEAPPPSAPALPASDTEPLRVLVVDDNVDQVSMLSSALRLMGYSVQSAYSGPAALDLARSWQPDIALLDIGLPGMDGYEVARRLCSDPKLRRDAAKGAGLARLRLIALTGYGTTADVALAREAGFDGHMVKPCDFVELEKLMATPLPLT